MHFRYFTLHSAIDSVFYFNDNKNIKHRQIASSSATKRKNAPTSTAVDHDATTPVWLVGFAALCMMLLLLPRQQLSSFARCVFLRLIGVPTAVAAVVWLMRLLFRLPFPTIHITVVLQFNPYLSQWSIKLNGMAVCRDMQPPFSSVFVFMILFLHTCTELGKIGETVSSQMRFPCFK